MDKTSAVLPFETPSAARAAPVTTGMEVRARLRFKDAGVLPLVLLIGLGVVLTAAAVQDSAAIHRQAVVITTRLQMQAYRQNALEWQAIAEGDASLGIAAE